MYVCGFRTSGLTQTWDSTECPGVGVWFARADDRNSSHSATECLWYIVSLKDPSVHLRSSLTYLLTVDQMWSRIRTKICYNATVELLTGWARASPWQCRCRTAVADVHVVVRPARGRGRTTSSAPTVASTSHKHVLQGRGALHTLSQHPLTKDSSCLGAWHYLGLEHDECHMAECVQGGSKQNIPPENMQYLRNQWTDFKNSWSCLILTLLWI